MPDKSDTPIPRTINADEAGSHKVLFRECAALEQELAAKHALAVELAEMLQTILDEGVDEWGISLPGELTESAPQAEELLTRARKEGLIK